MVRVSRLLWASCALGDNTFIFPKGEKISAYKESSGKITKLWTKRLNVEVSSGGRIIKNSLKIGTEDDELISIDIVTGNTDWKLKVDGYIMFPPTLFKGNIFLAAGETVYSLNNNGEVIWRNNLGGRVSSPLKIDANRSRILATVYNEATVDTQHHDLVCLNAITGETFQRRMSKKNFRSSVMIGKSNFYVLTTDDLRKFGREQLKATAPATSRVPRVSEKVFGEIDIEEGKIIYQSDGGGVVYDVNNRKIIKEFPFHINSDVVICPQMGVSYFGIEEDGVGKICAIDTITLDVKWKSNLPANLSSFPVLNPNGELILRYDGSFLSSGEK